MPHAIRNSPRHIFHHSRPVQFHPVMTRIVKQQTRNLRNHAPESFRMLRRPRRKSRKRSRQQHASVRRIHKCLDFSQTTRQRRSRQRRAQRKQSLQQQRRNDRAIFHRAKRRRIRAKVSDRELRPAVSHISRSAAPAPPKVPSSPPPPPRPPAQAAKQKAKSGSPGRNQPPPPRHKSIFQW